MTHTTALWKRSKSAAYTLIPRSCGAPTRRYVAKQDTGTFNLPLVGYSCADAVIVWHTCAVSSCSVGYTLRTEVECQPGFPFCVDPFGGVS